MTERSLLTATLRGAIWNSLSFASSKGVTFIATLILARLLSPKDFGLMALGMIAINYLDTLGEMGVGQVVIYRQEDVEHNSNVAFTIGIIVNVFLSLAAFGAAPLMAGLFEEPRVASIMRALSVVFILSGLGSIHEARLKKELRFKTAFLPETGKTLAKALVSISMAFLGFGAWSLVWGQIAGTVMATGLYWLAHRWRPRLTLDLSTSRRLLGYSSQLVLANVMGMIINNIDYLIIGMRMNAESLGYYTMAFKVPELFINNACIIVSGALFPAYAKVQHDRDSLQKGFLLSLRYVALYTIPVGIGLAILARAFVRVGFGDQWLPAVSVLQALSIYALIYSISFNAGDIYKATGRPGIMNILGLFKLAVTIPLLWLAAGYDIYTVALAQVAATTLLSLVRLIVIGRIISLRLRDVLSALQPAATSAAIMLAALLFLQEGLPDLQPLHQLILLPLAGGLAYLAALRLTNRRTVEQGLSLLRNTLAKRRQ